MFRAPSCPSSGERYETTTPVVYNTGSAVHHRRCRLCTVLLMMGMMMPETCWDTNKYIIFSAFGWLFIHLHSSLSCNMYRIAHTFLYKLLMFKMPSDHQKERLTARSVVKPIPTSAHLTSSSLLQHYQCCTPQALSALYCSPDDGHVNARNTLRHQ
jgi:hypothetical protein